MQITNIDQSFTNIHNDIDISNYIPLQYLNNMCSLMGISHNNGVLSSNYALLLIKQYIPSLFKDITSKVEFDLDSFELKLLILLRKSLIRTISDTEELTLFEIINEKFNLNITEAVRYINHYYIPFEQVEEFFKVTHPDFSFLKASLNLNKILTNGESLLVPLEYILEAENDEYNIKFDFESYKKYILEYITQFAFIFNEKKSLSDLGKSMKLKLDKKKRKTYLMVDKKTGHFKIGYSKNPDAREKTLQSEKPDIKLLITCNENIEKELHKKYSDKRVRGEWFNLTEENLTEIINIFKTKNGFTYKNYFLFYSFM